MKILFVHQNFPAQFVHLAAALTASSHHEIRALTFNNCPIPKGVIAHGYEIKRTSSKEIHPWLVDFETKTIRGEAAFHAALAMKHSGFYPDIIIAHPGWGESLFLKEVWPQARVAIYCEFYYLLSGGEIDFDSEFRQATVDDACLLRLKNANQDLQLLHATRGLSPTYFQRSVFPETFQNKIDVIHDGINTQVAKPKPNILMHINGETFKKGDEIITFVNRDLEPLRGYHIFMRALPQLLEKRPHARVIIVGGDEVSYGQAAPDGKKWKHIFLDEVRAKLDMSRVYFVGKIPYEYFIQFLQISSVHVYLTYPFVLSWSLLEAMSCGCAIVASNTAPVREVITHNETGRLVDFFEVDNLSAEIIALLDDSASRDRLGKAARQYVIDHYDLHSTCLPKQMAWVHSLLDM